MPYGSKGFRYGGYGGSLVFMVFVFLCWFLMVFYEHIDTHDTVQDR